MAAGEHQIAVWNTGGNGKVLIYPYWTMPFSSASRIGPLSGIWYQSRRHAGRRAHGRPHARCSTSSTRRTVTVDEAKPRTSWPRRSSALNLANLWTIGTVGGTPLEQGVVVVKNNFRNVPESTAERHVYNEDSVHTPANCVPAQYFMRQA